MPPPQGAKRVAQGSAAGRPRAPVQARIRLEPRPNVLACTPGGARTRGWRLKCAPVLAGVVSRYGRAGCLHPSGPGGVPGSHSDLRRVAQGSAAGRLNARSSVGKGSSRATAELACLHPGCAGKGSSRATAELACLHPSGPDRVRVATFLYGFTDYLVAALVPCAVPACVCTSPQFAQSLAEEQAGQLCVVPDT